MTALSCAGPGGRGCACAFHARRRVYSRNYARRQRARVVAGQRMSARTCPRRFGRYGVCGGVLESDVIDGVIVVTCPLCDRFARGICRDCPAPVAGTPRKARRCAVHTEAARLASCRKHGELHVEERRRSARRNYQKNAARRAAKNEYKRAWRKANRDKVRAQKRREALRPNARRVAYQAERRAREREALAGRERARARGITELRTCVTPDCDIVVTGRKKKCTKCKAREAAAAVQVLAAHAGKGRRTDLERVA